MNYKNPKADSVIFPLGIFPPPAPTFPLKDTEYQWVLRNTDNRRDELELNIYFCSAEPTVKRTGGGGVGPEDSDPKPKPHGKVVPVTDGRQSLADG